MWSYISSFSNYSNSIRCTITLKIFFYNSFVALCFVTKTLKPLEVVLKFCDFVFPFRFDKTGWLS